MKQKILESFCYLVNGLSIAAFFFLTSTLEVSQIRFPLPIIAWLLFGLGLVLVVLSTVTLITNRKSGLIEWGIYGVVRHPMYLGAILFFLSWIFFVPHWIIILISLLNSFIVYWFVIKAERQNIATFGNAYQRYMESVPRLNLLAGLLSFLQNR